LSFPPQGSALPLFRTNSKQLVYRVKNRVWSTGRMGKEKGVDDTVY